MKNWLIFGLLGLSTILNPAILVAAPAGGASGGGGGGAPSVSYPSDNNKFDGDHLKLRVTINKFKIVDGDNVDQCAPKDSNLVVTKDGVTLGNQNNLLLVRFIDLPKSKDFFGHDVPQTKDCNNKHPVNTHTEYYISKDDLNKYDFSRTGFTFGGMVIPFKFYLGKDNKKLLPSSTIAPYLGYRGIEFLGLSISPVASAGLGFVPVSNPNTSKTETKNALSTAVGLIITSPKNQAFNAGLVLGRDYLSTEDSTADPAVTKGWISLYFGYGI